jgi:hypothetical protein
MATAGGFLDHDDLRQLTGAARRAGQIAWLQAEGVPFRTSGRGEPLVAWVHVHAWLEGKPPVSFVEPDLSNVE